MTDTATMNAGIEKNSAISMRRMLMLAKYWWPRLRVNFWICLCTTVLLSISAALINLHLGTIKGSMLSTAIIYLGILSPAVFGVRKGREYDIALPATNTEKVVFRLIYSLIVIPAITYGLDLLITFSIVGADKCQYLTMNYLTQNGVDCPNFDNIQFTSQVCNVIYYLCIIIITLYGASFYKRNTVTKTICTSVACYIIPAFLLGVAAGLYGFYVGYTDAIADKQLDVREVTHAVYEMLPIASMSYAILATAISIIMLILLFRRYPKRSI